MEDKENKKRERKSQFHWKREDESNLIKIVKKFMPYNKGHGEKGVAWGKVEEEFNGLLKESGREVTLPDIKTKMIEKLDMMKKLQAGDQNVSGVIDIAPFWQKDLLDLQHLKDGYTKNKEREKEEEKKGERIWKFGERRLEIEV